MTLCASELERKLVHIGVGGFAFLLRDLPWWAAIGMAVSAFLFNWQVLPRIGGRRLWRGVEHAEGHPLGILLYPLSVLGLVLAFPGANRWMAAAVWGILACGDGMAALLGQALRGPRLPWNEAKGWIGFCAFVVFGTLGASLLAAWTLGLPLAAALSRETLGITLPVVLLCALTESAATTLDDNLTVPLVGALSIPLVAGADAARLLADPDLGSRLVLGLSLCAALAALACAARLLDVAGAISAVAIGAAIMVGLGAAALAVMIAFFVAGSAATKLGRRTKAARGIAQLQGGTRGWRHAWANGGVPACLALLGGMSDAKELFALAYAASVATAAADTCASEVGKAYGRRAYLITSLRAVPPGTSGAVSLEGTLGGLAGGSIVASVGGLLGLHPPRAALLVALAGLVGSLAESVIGRTARRKGWMDSHLLNALNTALGAALVAALVRLAPRWAS